MYKFILMIGLLAFSVTGFCQDEDPVDKKIDKKCDEIFGITIGPIASGIGGESDSYFGILLGLYFGIDLDLICFTENLRLSGSLAFSQMGSKYKENMYEPGGGGVTNESKLRLSYLTLPITARYKGDKGFAAEAGLQPGLLLSAKDKHANGTDDAKDLFNTFDMGVVLGAGYQPPGKKWGVGLRVVPGITNINKSESPYQVKDRNFSTSLRVSYRL
jgi:hypothetical protein